MLPCDSANIALDVVRRLRERGFYACPCLFPAVPVNQPAVRYTITRHNSLSDIDDFVVALTTSYPRSQSARRHARRERSGGGNFGSLTKPCASNCA